MLFVCLFMSPISFLEHIFVLCYISSVYEEAVKKLCDDTAWKETNPTFTYDLWHSRSKKKYLIMTAHWMYIGGSELQP